MSIRLPSALVHAALLFLCVALSLAGSLHAADPVLRHIAVVGDVAAQGVGPSARVDGWPDQFARLLGPEFATKTFIRSNASLDPKSPRFVMSAPEWKWLASYSPECVVLQLGAADASTVGFPAASRLDDGIRQILDSLDLLPSKPRVVVCLPPPCQPTWPRASTYLANRQRVVEAWKRVATPRGVSVLDLEPALTGLESTLVDGVSADPNAAERVAIVVASDVLGRPPEVSSSIYRLSGPPVGLGRMAYVDEGVPNPSLVGAANWQEEAGRLVNRTTDPLSITLHAGEGPFRIRARMTLEGGAKSAAQLMLDEQFILLEDGTENVRLVGEIFRGKPVLGRSIDFWQRGEEFELEVRRVHHDLEILIDGKLMMACPAGGWTFKMIALIPMTSTVRLRSWVVDEGMPTMTPPPFSDLADRVEHQVIVDRRDGQYLGHPSTVLMPDQTTIYCAYPLGHGRGAIILRKSSDGGQTWSQPLPTPANWASSLETPTLYRIADPTRDGASRLLLFSGLYPSRMSASDDDGATWSDLAPMGNWGGIVTMASVIQARDSRSIAFFHDDGHFLKADGKGTSVSTVYATETRDGGRTWSEPRALLSKPTVFLCEPGVVRAPSGKRLAMLLRENSRTRNSFISFSDDDGSTWTEPRELPWWLTGDRHVIATLPDGRLFISMRDMARTSPTYGDWTAWIGTWDDLESGASGSMRLRLMDNHDGTDCGYAGVEVLGDGTVVATSYGHWDEGKEPYIVCVRLPPDLLAPGRTPAAGSGAPTPDGASGESTSQAPPASEPPPADAP